MRTRYMGYNDYNMDADDVKSIRHFCESIEAGSDDDSALKKCCQLANNDVAVQLYTSLVEGLSYDEIFKREYIPLGRNDFYGYRRKAIARFFQIKLDEEWSKVHTKISAREDSIELGGD